jgi:hypothetical protein
LATSHNRPVTPTQQAAVALLRRVVREVLGSNQGQLVTQ